MRHPDLTLEEREALRQVFGNAMLLSAIRKVEADQADYWRNMGRSEALQPEPRPSLLVQYAAREAAAMGVEMTLKSAAGILKSNQEE